MGQTLDRLRQCTIRTRIVLGPEREPFPPVSVEPAAIAVQGAWRIHEPSESPLGSPLPVGGKRHGFGMSFYRRVLTEGALCVKEAEHSSGKNKRAAGSP